MVKNKNIWQANWIWHPPLEKTESLTDSLLPSHPMDNFFLYARKVFTLNGKPKNSRVRCTCSDEYKLFINGKFVGRGPSPCEPEWQYFDEYEISGYLKPGRNVFGLICYHYGTVSPHTYFPQGFIKKPGVILEAGIIEKSGREFKVLTDNSWRVIQADAWLRNTPRLNIVHSYQEVFDSGKDTTGWFEEDYNDSGWKVPAVIGRPPVKPWINLIPRAIPFLKYERLRPTAIISAEDNLGKITGAENLIFAKTGISTIDASTPGSLPSITLDFGREVVGYPVIKFRKVEKGTITFYYGENLALLRDIDRLITRPGLKEWSPFRRSAFRYLKMTFHAFPEPIELKSVTLDLVHYPVERRGRFQCSDDTLNRIWEVASYTTELTMQDHFEDCPWREGNAWLGDSLVALPCSYYAFGDYGLAAKFFQDMTRCQKPDGSLPAFCPTRNDLLMPDYCADYAISLYRYYLHSGDVNIIRETFPVLSRLMAWFKARLDRYGLLDWGEREIGGKDGWCFIDWADIDRRGEITALQFIYHHALDCAVRIAAALGEEKSGAEWLSDVEKIKGLIEKRLWDKTRGVYSDCRTKTGLSGRVSQTTNALAMYFGVAPEERWTGIQKYIEHHEGVAPIKTSFMNIFYAEVLFRSGRDAEAIKLIRDYWGEMVRRGATTFWEEFNRNSDRSFTPGPCPNFDHSGDLSLCHGWSAGPAYLLPKMVLGIRPLSPGFKTFSVEPYPAGLDWAEGAVPTPAGDITVSWKKDKNGKGLEMKVSVPQGTRAEVGVPATELLRASRVDINGQTVWVDGRQTELPAWVGKACRREDRILFSLNRAGSYLFKVWDL